MLILNTHDCVSFLVLICSPVLLDNYNCGLFPSSKHLVRFTSNLLYWKSKACYVALILLQQFIIYMFVFFLFIFFSSVFPRSVQCIDLRSKSNMDG